MRVSGILLSLSQLVLLALCSNEPFTPADLLPTGNSRDNLWRNETDSATLITQWPEFRIRRFLELRGRLDSGDTNIPRDELVTMASAAISQPIITSLTSSALALFTEDQCSHLTVDQIVYWAAHYSGRRVNSHGANVFDAPPTLVRSKAKRVAAVELCRELYRERVYGVKKAPPRDASELNGEDQQYMGTKAFNLNAQRQFSAQVAEAESSPHIFEPDINPALDRAAKHSIHDLRALLDVFGVSWAEDETHEVLTQRAKLHTSLWSGSDGK